MPIQSRTTPLACLVAATALAFGLLAAPAATAVDAVPAAAHDSMAATSKAKRKPGQMTQPIPKVSRGTRVLRAAESRRGSAYVYGASGPRAFDCSGLTQWAYRQAGKRIPRTSGAQAASTRRVTRRAARPGDLVFFHSGGRVYHVGIYAGGNSVIHASRPGVPVGRARIWTSSIFFGRVR